MDWIKFGKDIVFLAGNEFDSVRKELALRCQLVYDEEFEKCGTSGGSPRTFAFMRVVKTLNATSFNHTPEQHSGKVVY